MCTCSTGNRLANPWAIRHGGGFGVTGLLLLAFVSWLIMIEPASAHTAGHVMFAWSLSIFFGVIGVVAGNLIPMGASKTNGPLWMLGFGVLFAILGAIVGGSMDIVNIIKQRTAKPTEKHV